MTGNTDNAERPGLNEMVAALADAHQISDPHSRIQAIREYVARSGIDRLDDTHLRSLADHLGVPAQTGGRTNLIAAILHQTIQAPVEPVPTIQPQHEGLHPDRQVARRTGPQRQGHTAPPALTDELLRVLMEQPTPHTKADAEELADHLAAAAMEMIDRRPELLNEFRRPARSSRYRLLAEGADPAHLAVARAEIVEDRLNKDLLTDSEDVVDEVASAADWEIIRWTDRHYEGGWERFAEEVDEEGVPPELADTSAATGKPRRVAGPLVAPAESPEAGDQPTVSRAVRARLETYADTMPNGPVRAELKRMNGPALPVTDAKGASPWS